MISKLIKKDNYNLHLYKTDVFKTIQVNVVLTSEAKEDNYLVNALRSLLFLTNKYYKTKRELIIKQEDLYDEGFVISLNRFGRMTSIEFSVDFINPKLVKDDYKEEAIKFLFDVINNPVFDESQLDKIKDSLKLRYKNATEQPGDYSYKRALEEFFDDPKDNIRFLVKDDIVDSITMDMIKNKYEEIVNNSNVDIFLLGDVDDSYVQYIDKYNIFKSANKELEYNIITDTRDEVKIVTETKKDINQAQIYMFYNVLGLEKLKRLQIVLYNMILGNGFSSRLFKTVREENKLCYNIYSSNDNRDSLMYVYTAVDNNNIDKAIELIKDCIEGMKKIDESELIEQKVKHESFENSAFDNLSFIYSRDYAEYFLGIYSVDEEKELIDSISVEDIIKMNDNIKLNCIYVLKGE